MMMNNKYIKSLKISIIRFYNTTVVRSVILSKYVFFILIILSSACNDITMPKPYGYFRVDLPEHNYRVADTLNLPYKFDISSSASIVSRNENGEKCWIDIQYPMLNASVYCSYKPVKSNLYQLSEDSRRYVYKHSVKADGISEKVYENREKNVYGILYDIKGNTASSVQFVLTDSTKNFFRAALYFNNVPNKDSISPMLDYVRRDMIRMMESFEWKK